jgi:hypothetical protein
LKVDIDVLKCFVEVANGLIREGDAAPEPVEAADAE